MKFAIAIALLLLCSTAVMAKMAKTELTSSSFAEIPKSVIDTSQAEDKLFLDSTATTLFFSAGESADQLYVWTVNWDEATNSSKSIIKRTIDAKTLEAKDKDVTLDLKIKSKVGLISAGGLGYIGLASLRDDGADTPDQLYFSILPASADSDTKLEEVKLTDNKDSSLSFFINRIFFDDDTFYILFTKYKKSDELETELLLQGVKTDGSLLFSSGAVKVASLNNPLRSTHVITGLNLKSDPKMVYVVYKLNDTSTVMQTTVDISNGKVDEPTKLVADSETMVYFPDGIISATDAFGIVLAKEEKKGENIEESLIVYYDGATSKPQKLELTAPKGYMSPLIRSFDYKDGFIILAQFIGESDAAFVLKLFKSDGTEKEAQKLIGTSQSSMLFFLDADKNLWLGYTDFDLSTGKVSKGYLGKVLAAE